MKDANISTKQVVWVTIFLVVFAMIATMKNTVKNQ